MSVAKSVECSDKELQGGKSVRGYFTALYYALLIVALSVVRFMELPHGMSVHELQAALVVSFTLIAWAWGVLEEPIPTLIFFLLVVIFDVVSAKVVFSGFSSTAWWLVFAGSVVGVAIKTTGVGARIATLVFSGWATSYRQYLYSITLLSVALAFLMPSTMGRILLLTPIVIALAKEVGLAPGSKGHTGFILAVAIASYLPPTAILPANLPNSVLMGAAESLYGIHLSYGSYLLAHFPVLGILKAFLIVEVIARLFPESRLCRPVVRKADISLSISERNLLAVLVVSVALFVTDFAHGVSPAWVSLAAAVLCLWPAANIMSVKTFADNVHIVPLIYVAGFLGLGAVVAESGIGLKLGRFLLEAAQVSRDAPALGVSVLTSISSLIGLITTLPSLPAVLTPLAKDFAEATGLSIYSVLMLQVPVYGLLIFPYQCPPIVVAMAMGGVSLKDGTKLCLVLTLITALTLFPLDYFWLKYLGLV